MVSVPLDEQLEQQEQNKARDGIEPDRCGVEPGGERRRLKVE
jgi:hypothetical protein